MITLKEYSLTDLPGYNDKSKSFQYKKFSVRWKKVGGYFDVYNAKGVRLDDFNTSDAAKKFIDAHLDIAYAEPWEIDSMHGFKYIGK